MEQVTTIGLDVAKNVFQLHGVGAAGNVLLRKQLRRGDVLRFFSGLSPCLVGMEACATAHYWARELSKLGHTVRLMPPAYVKPYVKRGKTDAADAEAIAEAVTRPTMRFVAVKTAEQQAVLMLHKVRDLLVRQRTMLINALRGHLAEFGIIAARGPGGVTAAIVALHEAQDSLPVLARVALHGLVDQLRIVRDEVVKVEKRIVAQHRADDASRRLATIPGIGPITASAIAAAVPDATLFKSGRQFAAWLGLTPRTHSSGGRSDSSASPSRVTVISDASWSSVRPRSSGLHAETMPARRGPPSCSSANRPGWYQWRLPTRPRGSPGRCSPAINPTWLRPCSRSPARPNPVKR